MHFGLVGMAAAGTDVPSQMVPQQRFWVVVRKNGQTFFSFDGEHLVWGDHLASWAMLLGPGEEGGEAAMVLIVGRPQGLPPELR